MGDGTYHNSGRSFFLRYYGHDLHLSCFNRGEKTYVIRSRLASRLRSPNMRKSIQSGRSTFL